jgi:hypothetical protein
VGRGIAGKATARLGFFKKGSSKEQATTHIPEDPNLRRTRQALSLLPATLIAPVDLIQVSPEALRFVIA